MGLPTVREVVVVPFSFSDSAQLKVRPAICLANAGRGEWVLCQITSTGQGDPNALSIGTTDFEIGGLQHHSFVRPLKLFTAHERRFARSLGIVSEAMFARIVSTLVSLLQS
jgi:mRNA interferase MazF